MKLSPKNLRFSLNKREKIIIATTLVTIGLLMTQGVNFFYLNHFIIGLTIFSFFVSLWALWAGMSILKAFTLLMLPTLFTFGVATFYLLLPSHWGWRLPVNIIFGLSFYFLLLSQNVFNVAAIRTIPLYRAASTVTFIYTILTASLLLHSLHALSLSFIWNGLITAVISFLLILPILWSVKMEGISLQLFIYSLALAVILGEVAVALSFWPIPPTSLMWAITLTSVLFILLGLNLDYLRERLSSREVYLYMGFGVLVLAVTFLTTSWTG